VQLAALRHFVDKWQAAPHTSFALSKDPELFSFIIIPANFYTYDVFNLLFFIFPGRNVSPLYVVDPRLIDPGHKIQIILRHSHKKSCLFKAHIFSPPLKIKNASKALFEFTDIIIKKIWGVDYLLIGNSWVNNLVQKKEI
jgi:hypothetical protein